MVMAIANVMVMAMVRQTCCEVMSGGRGQEAE